MIHAFACISTSSFRTTDKGGEVGHIGILRNDSTNQLMEAHRSREYHITSSKTVGDRSNFQCNSSSLVVHQIKFKTLFFYFLVSRDSKLQEYSRLLLNPNILY